MISVLEGLFRCITGQLILKKVRQTTLVHDKDRGTLVVCNNRGWKSLPRKGLYMDVTNYEVTYDFPLGDVWRSYKKDTSREENLEDRIFKIDGTR